MYNNFYNSLAKPETNKRIIHPGRKYIVKIYEKMFNFVKHQSKITRYSKHIFAIVAELGWRGDSVVKKSCS